MRARLAGLPATPDLPSCPKPTIQAVLSNSPVSPGEEIVLNGCGFGAARPHVRLIGQFPNGFLELEILPPWRDRILVARVPATSGVSDQPARITVLRNDLTIGNDVPLGFRASRSVYWLQPEDVSISCAKRPGDCRPISIPEGTVPGTAGASHQVLAGDFLLTSLLWTDTVSVHLANGWGLYDYGFATEDVMVQSELAFTKPPTGFVAGASSATLSIESILAGRSGIKWSLFLYAIGPTGTSPH